MAVRDCLFDLTLLIEQRNNILTVHVGLTDNGINNIYCQCFLAMLMSSEIERNSPINEIFKVENHRSECGKCHLRDSRFQNFPGGHAPVPP